MCYTKKSSPIIIGHRGARAYAPENTISGYKAALEQQVDCIDVDVVVTRDMVLLAYHDLLLNPDILCSIDGSYLANSKAAFMQQLEQYNFHDVAIKHLTLSELKQRYRVKLNHNSPYAQWFPDQKNAANTYLASLQEVVDYVNQATNGTMPIQVEIKNSFDHPQWCYSADELAHIMYEQNSEYEEMAKLY